MSGQLPAAMLGGLLYCNPFAPLMVQSPSVYSKRPAPSDENLESSKKKKKRTRSAPKTGAAVNWKQINVLGGDKTRRWKPEPYFKVVSRMLACVAVLTRTCKRAV